MNQSAFCTDQRTRVKLKISNAKLFRGSASKPNNNVVSEFFTTVRIFIMIIWVTTPDILVVNYKRFFIFRTELKAISSSESSVTFTRLHGVIT